MPQYNEVTENPKLIQALKDGKAPLEYLVYSVLPGDAAVHKGGADKYGIRNWLIDKIKASTYEAAILRHLIAWAEGEDVDPESGHSHLYHIRACCAIVLDAQMNDTLIDDRDRCESIDKRTREADIIKTADICETITGAFDSRPLTMEAALRELRSPKPPIGQTRPEHEVSDIDLDTAEITRQLEVGAGVRDLPFIDPFDAHDEDQKIAIDKLNPISEVPLIK